MVMILIVIAPANPFVSKEQQQELFQLCLKHDIDKDKFQKITGFAGTRVVPVDKFDEVKEKLSGTKK